MSRILFISNTSWYLFNHRLNLMQSLEKAGYEVTFLAPYDSYTTKIPFHHHHLKINSQSVNPFKELILIYMIFRSIRKIKPDLVINFTIKPNIYGALVARIMSIPFINNVTGLGDSFIKRNLVMKILLLLFRITMPYARMIFFQNRDDLDLFFTHKLISKNRYDLLPGSGIDLEKFLPRDREMKNGFIFLLYGRLLRKKGIVEYVEAARKIKSKYPEVQFNILGFLDVDNPSAISRTEMQAWHQEGVVKYLGSTDDVRDFIAESDCIVFPSYYREGVPRVLLEAASMAKPVITSDSTGCREAVDDGSTGFLSIPRNVPDLVNKMEKMINLKPAQRRLMGKKAREKMLHEFNEKIVIQKYTNYLQMLLKNQ